LQDVCQSRFAALLRVRAGRGVKNLTPAAHQLSVLWQMHIQDTENHQKNEFGTPIAFCLGVSARLRRPVPDGTAQTRPVVGRTTSEGMNGTMASDKLFGIHATALQLRSQRMMMLASNIANAATPHYKARDLDFSKALDLAQQGGSMEDAVAYRVPVQASLDGNTVEMATEQTAFAENALAYRSSLSFLSGRVNTLTRALKGE